MSYIDGDQPDEIASEESEDTESLLRLVLDHVAAARRVPVSTSVMVDREELMDLLQTALDRLPDELRQARWLLRERDDLLDQTRREAQTLMEDVRAQVEQMVQRTEVVRQANQAAQRIVDEARSEARRLKHEAEDFCDQKLAAFEIVLDRTTKTVQAGRDRLQAVPTPPVGSPGGGASTAQGVRGALGPEDEGDLPFFDQDE